MKRDHVGALLGSSELGFNLAGFALQLLGTGGQRIRVNTTDDCISNPFPLSLDFSQARFQTSAVPVACLGVMTRSMPPPKRTCMADSTECWADCGEVV
jgi:hypothetical protein